MFGMRSVCSACARYVRYALGMFGMRSVCSVYARYVRIALGVFGMRSVSVVRRLVSSQSDFILIFFSLL